MGARVQNMEERGVSMTLPPNQSVLHNLYFIATYLSGQGKISINERCKFIGNKLMSDEMVVAICYNNGPLV